MRAFIIEEFGQPGSVGERAKPEPGEGEILVRVKAAGVNAMDPVFRAGWAQSFMEHRMPLTPGLDYAGTVEAVGPGVDGFAPGDEVFGSVGKMHAGDGSFAEYVTANATVAAKRPEALPVDQAAALPTSGGTAIAAVDTLAAADGDSVAIVGAAGGVGSIATQLAAARGLRVIAVTKGEHADFVRGLGAAEVVDYTEGDVAAQLRQRYPEGVAGIVDLFDDAPGAAALAGAVRPGGRIVSSSAMGLDQALSGQAVTGHFIGPALDRVGELGDLAAAGRLRIETEVLSLDRAAEALDRQMGKTVRGKQVLAISGDA